MLSILPQHVNTPSSSSTTPPTSPRNVSFAIPSLDITRRNDEDDFSLPLASPGLKRKTVDSSRPISAYAPLLLPLLLFPLSSVLTLAALTTLPLPSPLPTSPTPKSLALIVSTLSQYAGTTLANPFALWPTMLPTLHLLIVLSMITIWKHAWSVPGAVLLNVIAGGLWGGISGTLVMSLLTAVGSISATMISRPLSSWIESLMPRAVQITKTALDSHEESVERSAPWARLSLLRLIGVVPWSGLNIASGIVRVPIWDCFVGALIGCAPWTAVTCQAGDILTNVGTSLANGEDGRPIVDILKSWDVIVKLVFLTLLSLLPIFAKGAMKRLLAPRSDSNTPSADLNEKDKTFHHERTLSWKWRFGSRSSPLSKCDDEEKSELSSQTHSS